MRSVAGRALRKIFERRFLDAVPQFQRVKGESVPQGSLLFCWPIKPTFHAYVMLIVSPSTDEFTLEGAWSKKNQFPHHLGIMHPLPMAQYDIVADDPRDGEFRMRLTELWDHRKGGLWWKATSQKLLSEMTIQEVAELDHLSPQFDPVIEVDEEFIARQVDCALSAVAEFAIPYFESVAEKWQ